MGSVFSKMFGGLTTNPGPSTVTSDAGTQSFTDPTAAGKAIAAASAATAQPGRSTVDGTIGAPTVTETQVGNTPYGGIGPMLARNVETTPGQDRIAVGETESPAGKQPTAVINERQKSWSQAIHDGNGGLAALNPELSTKGKILGTLLQAGLGAIAGDAAARVGDPRHGYAGAAAGGMAGMELPFKQRMEQLQLQKTAAETGNIAAMNSAELALKKAQADAAAAAAARRFTYQDRVTGDVNRVEDDGTVTTIVKGNHPDKPETDNQLAMDAAQGDETAKKAWALKHPDKPLPVTPAGLAMAASDPNNPKQAQAQAALDKMVTKKSAKNLSGSGNSGTDDDINIVARGMVDGTIGVQALGRMAQGAKMKALAQAKRIDPSFDMTNFPARQKVATDFAAGKGADQIQSFNTFLAHSQDLNSAVNDFRLTGSPLINKPLVWLKNNSGDPAVASYLAKTEPVRVEFETFLQNNHALTESDKKEAVKVLDDNASPAQMQSTLKSMAHTAALRLREVNKRYANTMHKDYPGLLDPNNEKFLNDTGAMSALGGGAGSSSNNSSDPFAAFGGKARP
jgi:hypothetical protein